MINLKYLTERIKDVSFKDIMSIFPLTCAVLLRPFFKGQYKDVFLVCEEPYEARDNGYVFYKYLRTEHPEQKCIYAIAHKSADYAKVSKLGPTVEYGSVRHWIIYLLCKCNISSQKGGKPNAALCAFLELNNLLHVRNIFLQHGVIINDLKWLYADKSRIDIFITSTTKEYDFVKQKFGYSNGVVQYTGLARFDELHEAATNPNQILIMPTWRYWFNFRSKMHEDANSNFYSSEYYRMWLELLNSEELQELITERHLRVVFYLHRNLQRYQDAFRHKTNNIEIAAWENYDIQALLKESALLITDYSSVFFDMIYMKKPVVFYQFDEEKYRKYQYGAGYFDYHTNPFGECFRESEKVIACMKRIIDSGYQVSEQYLREHNAIFQLYDQQNCARIYQCIKENVNRHPSIRDTVEDAVNNKA